MIDKCEDIEITLLRAENEAADYLRRATTAEKALKILAKCLGQKAACEDCQFQGECRNEDVCAASQRYINWAVEKARELG